MAEQPQDAGKPGATPDADLSSVQDPGADLNMRQRTFAQLYSVTPNASGAYRASFPGAKDSTAYQEGPRLARDPRIVRYVEHLRKLGASQALATRDQKRVQLWNIANLDLRRAFEPEKLEIAEGVWIDNPNSGDLLPPHLWPEDIARAAQGYVVQRGNVHKVELKLPDKVSAMRLLAEMDGELKKDVNAGAPRTTFNFNLGGDPNRVKARAQPRDVTPKPAQAAKPARRPRVIEQKPASIPVERLERPSAPVPGAQMHQGKVPPGLFK